MNQPEYYFSMTTLEFGTEEFGPYFSLGERADAITSVQDSAKIDDEFYCEIEKFEKEFAEF